MFLQRTGKTGQAPAGDGPGFTRCIEVASLQQISPMIDAPVTLCLTGIHQVMVRAPGNVLPGKGAGTGWNKGKISVLKSKRHRRENEVIAKDLNGHNGG